MVKLVAEVFTEYKDLLPKNKLAVPIRYDKKKNKKG
jgi:hypothetical protein